jgi:hypothetical protein
MTIIIILGLGSTNEWEHTIFGLLSLAYLTRHNGLHFHPFSCNKYLYKIKKNCFQNHIFKISDFQDFYCSVFQHSWQWCLGLCPSGL